MCGIAGIIRFDGTPVECAEIKRMTDSIAHRGPDGEGQWCEGSVGLGHRRLAIIDLSADAAQPMHSPDGRYIITYNGEVYNFRELRRELEKSGSRFRSHSDTEVVLEAVIRWGIDSAIKRFNGMFAFAVWDRQERVLVLGRDRYGIKPLYIWTSHGQIAFASEPKAFRALPSFRADLDVHGVAEYLTFQNILTDRTFLKDVKVFPAGHWGRLPLDVEHCELQQVQYWDFDFQEPENPASDAEYVEELRRLLFQAVDRQLVSDVEVGAYLSGGLDSGSLVAIAAQQLPAMKTFTIGFEMKEVAQHEKHFDERAAAESIAAFVGTTQIEMVIGPRHVTAAMPHLTDHLEEPRVGQSYPNYYAAQLAGRFVKVVLAGTGGDEILGGYPWRYPPPDLREDGFTDWHFQIWNRLLSRAQLNAVLDPVLHELAEFDAHRIHAALSDPLSLSPGRHREFRSALYFESKTFLAGLLCVEDRLSMAHGLETRVPFLDNDLVDFGQTIPRAMRVSNSTGSMPRGKTLLRQAFKEDLPSAILQGRKQGFSGPDSMWYSGLLRPDIMRSLCMPSEEVWNAEAARDLLMQQGADGANSRLLAWSLWAMSLHLAS